MGGWSQWAEPAHSVALWSACQMWAWDFICTSSHFLPSVLCTTTQVASTKSGSTLTPQNALLQTVCLSLLSRVCKGQLIIFYTVINNLSGVTPEQYLSPTQRQLKSKQLFHNEQFQPGMLHVSVLKLQPWHLFSKSSVFCSFMVKLFTKLASVKSWLILAANPPPPPPPPPQTHTL